MPTIPLNLLAFLSERLALRMAKRSPLPSSSSTQTAFPYRPAYARKRSSPATRIPFLHAAWLGSYCTGSSLLDQPRRVPQISSALRGGFRKWIEKRDCRAPQETFDLQLRNGLGTVPENDSAALQQRAARVTCCCFFRCRLDPFLLQHPKCTRRSLRRSRNSRRL